MSLSYNDYYELLDISKEASLEQIQQAYHKARSLYAPDSPAIYSMFSEEEAKELMRVIDEAYSTLSNNEKRKQYDLSLNATDNNTYNDDVMDDAIYGLSGEAYSQSDLNHTGTQVSTAQIDSSPVSDEPQADNDAQGSTRFGPYFKDPEVELYIQQEENTDGEFLKTVREYKNISVDQISSFTKIGKHHIIAIEENQYKELPPPVFAKAFVKQYAKLLDLDAQKCADQFIVLMKQHIS